MKFRSIDGEGDWVFGAGVQSYAIGESAILLDIQTKLSTFLTECFFDQTVGVPWFQLLSSKDINALILTLKQAIVNIDGVTGVSNLDFVLDSERNATVRYEVSTIYSQSMAGTVNL